MHVSGACNTPVTNGLLSATTHFLAQLGMSIHSIALKAADVNLTNS